MTGKQWRTGTVGEKLAAHWGERFTERKARLLMLACCRRHPSYLNHADLRAAVEAVAAHYADPTVDEPLEGKGLRALCNRVHGIACNRQKEPGRGVAFGVYVTVEPASLAKERKHPLKYLIYSCLDDIATGFEGDAFTAEHAAQADLVREIIGDPFQRPKPKVKPAWRTDTVLALARRIYTAEEFGAMPILADALQDAGCDSDDILSHCRGTAAPHVRGCWVLDLLLGTK